MDPASASATLMFAEARAAADAVAAQSDCAATLDRICSLLRDRGPHTVITCARGSSDHAATYAKYLIETRLGIPTASAAPSVTSLYAAPLHADGMLAIAISQSGRSPDLLATVRSLKAGGAFVIALVNDCSSPLADLCDEVLPLRAGTETSVAATKSFIATLAMIARLVARWTEDAALERELAELPAKLHDAFELDWSAMVDQLVECDNAYVLGRGLGLGIAQEAALKLKETSQIHAEAFSTAELQHGPMALVGPGLPLLLFGQSDAAGSGEDELVVQLRERGAPVLVAGRAAGSGALLPIIAGSAVTEPILQIQAFYRAANALAVARGRDPDQPPYLRKVTRTV
ncbi:MAG: SIS domain-containing protein [Sphingomicrobium sp.]